MKNKSIVKSNYKHGFIGFYGSIDHYTKINWNNIKNQELEFRARKAYEFGDIEQSQFFMDLIAIRN